MLSDVKEETNNMHHQRYDATVRRNYVRPSRRNVSLNGLFAWPGFKQVPLLIQRRIRREQSTYTFVKRVSLFTKSIVDFSASHSLQFLLAG